MNTIELGIKVKGSVNKMKKKFEKGLSENAKKNPKSIWRYIKSKSKTREGIADLHTNPEDTNSEKTEIERKLPHAYHKVLF